MSSDWVAWEPRLSARKEVAPPRVMGLARLLSRPIAGLSHGGFADRTGHRLAHKKPHILRVGGASCAAFPGADHRATSEVCAYPLARSAVSWSKAAMARSKASGTRICIDQ